jgi:hypothetical protein
LVLAAGAPTNITYVVETTASLTPPIEWTDMMTNVVPPSGIIQFTNSTRETHGYYRIRFP